MMNRAKRKQVEKQAWMRKARTGVIVAGTAVAAMFIVFNGAAGLGNSTVGVARALEPEIYAEAMAVEYDAIPEQTTTEATTSEAVETKTVEPTEEAGVSVAQDTVTMMTVEKAPAKEETPIVEEEPVVEEAPTVEETVVEEAPVVEEIPAAEEQVPQQEEPVTEAVEVTETDDTMYASADLNIREQPTTDSAVVGSLAKGEEVKVVGICSNGWSLIKYNSTMAYVSSLHLVVERTGSNDASGTWESGTATMPATKMVLEGKISADTVILANQYYESIPANMRSRFEKDGWKFIITDKDIAQAYAPELSYLGSLAGLTFTDQKVIYLSGKERSVCSAMVHEFGHYVDYKNGMASRSDEFSDIFYSEAPQFSDGSYGQSSPEEFFAEVYKQAIQNPDVSKATVPKAYKFVMNCAAAL